MNNKRIISYVMAHKLSDGEIENISAGDKGAAMTYHFTFDSTRGSQDLIQD